MPSAVDPRAPRTAIASFPRVLAANPYQRLLYGALAEEGFELAPEPTFSLGWLRRHRRDVGVVHFHWPDAYYRVNERATLLSWAKLALFSVRLAAARAFGYRIAWTVHQVTPHVPAGRRLDRTAARRLARSADLLIAHDGDTAQRARTELAPRVPVHVVPHGSYIGAYPPGRPRAEVREELGAGADSFVFLSFGQLRADKELRLLLDAFARVPGDARLVVAGPVEDEATAEAVRAAAARDPRIVARIGFVPDAQVAELHAAADASVLPRGDGGTSGSLVLALSFGLPVVAADRPANLEATAGELAAWPFAPGDVSSLAAALTGSAADPAAARAKGVAARQLAEERTWPRVAAETATLLRATKPRAVRSIDVLLVCSSGGHLLQLLALREAWSGFERAWVTLPTEDARSLLVDERVFRAYGPTARNIPNLFRNLALAFRIVASTRPRVVLTTGAAIALPFAVAARLVGARFVYVESIARIARPSLTCRLVAPLADRVYAQWPELAEHVKGARYAGGVLAAR